MRTKKLKNIKVLKIDNKQIPGYLEWINIKNAKKKEIEYLRKKFKFNLCDLKDSLSKNYAQRPKIKERGNYIFIVLRFPYLDKKNKEILTEEVDFFLGKNFLVYLHNDKFKEINSFFHLCERDQTVALSFSGESSATLLYEILNRLFKQCFPLLDEIGIEIDEIEKKIFTSNKEKESVQDIMNTRHNIINFRRIMQTHKNMIKKMISLNSEFFPKQPLRAYYDKLLEQTKDIWEILENHKEVIEILAIANDSLLNYKISDIMKTLTIFSVIVFPLTLIATIFGMNTTDGMPFIHNQFGFEIVIVIMLFGSLFMLLFFEKKKWL